MGSNGSTDPFDSTDACGNDSVVDVYVAAMPMKSALAFSLSRRYTKSLTVSLLPLSLPLQQKQQL